MKKVYYDTSALIWLYEKGKAGDVSGFTRAHTLVEIFATLSGGRLVAQDQSDKPKFVQYSQALSAKIVRHFKDKLEFVDLTPAEIANVLDQAQSKAVRGGAAHDLMHLAAAEKCNAEEFLTLDPDFRNMKGTIPLKDPSA